MGCRNGRGPGQLPDTLSRARKLERLLDLTAPLHEKDFESPAYLERGLHALPEEKLLDILDIELQQRWLNAAPMEELLSEAGSAYAVTPNPTGLGHILTDRLPAAVSQLVDELTTEEEHWSTQLESARALIFGRAPNLVTGVNACVKAIEAAAVPRITPKDKKATLGTIIGELRKGNFAPPLRGEKRPSGEVVADMCALVWDTERQHRHGGNETLADPLSRESAEAAFTLSVTLVDWFSKGRVAPSHP